MTTRLCCFALILGAEVGELHAEEPHREPSTGPWRAPVDGGLSRLMPRLALNDEWRSLSRVAAPADSASAGTHSPTPLLGLRLPAFIAFGVGGLSASAAFATHLAAGMSAQYGDPKWGCAGSHCGSKAGALATTSAICAGVAAAAVGTGVVLMLFEPKREAPTFAPALKMSFSGNKAAAVAAWTF